MNKLKSKKRYLQIVPIFIAVFMLMASCNNFGKKIVVDGTEVFYKDGATKSQAEQLATYLKKEGFSDGTKKSVQLSIDEKTSHFIFKMIVSEDVATSGKKDFVFKSFSRNLSKEFGKPFLFQLCDNQFKMMREFKPSDIPKSIYANKTQIFYTDPMTETAVNKLADFLISSGFSDNNAKSVEIIKNEDSYTFKMVIRQGLEKNAKNVAVLRRFADEISTNVFDNKPLELHLCDSYLNTLKTVK
jgi:hypothetical protein